MLLIERSRSTLQVAENNDIFVAKYLSGVIVSVLQQLLAALNKRTEWGQVFILDALETLAKPKASSSVTPHPPASEMAFHVELGLLGIYNLCAVGA
jgi:hypothetical protein